MEATQSKHLDLSMEMRPNLSGYPCEVNDMSEKTHITHYVNLLNVTSSFSFLLF
jgi:hypothetical protein